MSIFYQDSRIYTIINYKNENEQFILKRKQERTVHFNN